MNKFAQFNQFRSKSGSNLTPQQKKMIAAAIAALAGGAVGSYVGGKKRRLLGALIGAAAAGGLTLASDSIGKTTSKALGAFSPPPKSQFSGVFTKELPIAAGLFAVPGLLQLGRPTDSHARAVFSGSDNEDYAQRFQAISDSTVPLRNPNRKDFQDLRHKLNKHHALTGVIDDAVSQGVFDKDFDGKWREPRKFLAQSKYRRPLVGVATLLATTVAGTRIYNRIQDNRAKIRRGWS